jgi:hypothetical protein
VQSDQVRELLDLAAVHSFYISVLEQVTGDSVPTPRDASRNGAGGSLLDHSLAVQHRWMTILDMAITPAMFRDALREAIPHETTEALLRYYITKKQHSESDRDKADFLTTFVYRNPPAWRKRETLPPPSDDYYVQFAGMQALEYEGELYSILGEIQPPVLAEEHYQLAKEFEHLHYEVDEFRHFDQIMDSGITARVRELKQRFGESFYHPRILATCAVYNAFFGKKFDELFRKTTEEIRSFAKKVQADGGSIMSRIDGDVLVKDLTNVEDTQVLHLDYGAAKENFRKVAKLKKAVDSRRSGRAPAAQPHPPAPVAAPAPPAHIPTPVSTPAPPLGATPAAAAAAAPAPAQSIAAFGASSQMFLKNEEHKITAAEDTIMNFVRVADAGAANVVPLRHGKILLADSEVDVFRNPFLGEKSFRADFAAKVRYLVGIQARLIVEHEEFTRTRQSEYLWKPHADSVKFLLTLCEKAIPEGEALAETAQKRGLGDKVKTMNNTIAKLRTQMQVCARALQA